MYQNVYAGILRGQKKCKKKKRNPINCLFSRSTCFFFLVQYNYPNKYGQEFLFAKCLTFSKKLSQIFLSYFKIKTNKTKREVGLVIAIPSISFQFAVHFRIFIHLENLISLFIHIHTA